MESNTGRDKGRKNTEPRCSKERERGRSPGSKRTNEEGSQRDRENSPDKNLGKNSNSYDPKIQAEKIQPRRQHSRSSTPAARSSNGPPRQSTSTSGDKKGSKELTPTKPKVTIPDIPQLGFKQIRFVAQKDKSEIVDDPISPSTMDSSQKMDGGVQENCIKYPPTTLPDQFMEEDSESEVLSLTGGVENWEEGDDSTTSDEVVESNGKRKSPDQPDHNSRTDLRNKITNDKKFSNIPNQNLTIPKFTLSKSNRDKQ